MKKMSIKIHAIFVAILLFIALLVFGQGTDSIKVAQKITQDFLLMLQEFASKDVIGII